ncbi:amidohydrolase family protein [Aquincola sp. S2]|uniref:Amidohydrolase family protein n=1 Tax=Pseudaquabacterium terrae TaxID=2732868 RepID=A0ABX2ELU9_9BURK|nr:amidohydrolase family protein [Aquabacterium terrae]NRF69578.1 amidohydrolase family protein [Aquabacterium terrae]
MRSHPNRRHVLGCCAAAAAGLFSGLLADDVAAAPPAAPAPDAAVDALLARCFDGLDPAALWDAHAHLLGVGDAGSGCRIHPHLSQWWHPVEYLRRQVILGAAGVDAAAPSIDRAYLDRLRSLTRDFPTGARWLLYAFDEAHDDSGTPRPDWSTFHVPDAYAAQVAAAEADRFAWVASIHPYRADALQRLDAALAGGALAIKWLPSAMNIDLRAARLKPFYERLAAADLPLIVHCGEEHAVPGAGRDELGNPLLLRAPLEAGVRVIAAHCASLGHAMDLDSARPRERLAFELFARLMDEAAWRGRLLGDVSAMFQRNRRVSVWREVLQRGDWHGRLLHGSDYPLPGIGPLYSLSALVRAELLDPALLPALNTLRARNPLLFDLALKRSLRSDGRSLAPAVFDTRAHLARGVSKVSRSGTV